MSQVSSDASVLSLEGSKRRLRVFCTLGDDGQAMVGKRVKQRNAGSVSQEFVTLSKLAEKVKGRDALQTFRSARRLRKLGKEFQSHRYESTMQMLRNACEAFVSKVKENEVPKEPAPTPNPGKPDVEPTPPNSPIPPSTPAPAPTDEARPTPTPTPIPLAPKQFSLAPIDPAQFSFEEARQLFKKFTFFADLERLNYAVEQGLDKTVEDLLTYKEDPELSAGVESILCTGAVDKECTAFSPLDYNVANFSKAENYRALTSANQFHQVYKWFLAEKRKAVTFGGLGQAFRPAMKRYMETLEDTVKSGDYRAYVVAVSNALV
ncbi:MAG: hypothetical protein KDD62_03925, partial [Bdellovibrionales bacterium]|nr:hypothetical protein [Bdellovibrionales bacterium]